MEGFIFILVAVAVLAVLAKVAFWVIVIKFGIHLFNAHQRAFDNELRKLQHDLTRLHAGGALTPAVSQRMNAEFIRASTELRHLDGIRREQSETRLAGMKTDLAEVGIFV